MTTGPDAQRRLTAEFDHHDTDAITGLGAAGNAGVVAGAVERLADSGAATAILVPSCDEPDTEAFVRYTGAQARLFAR